VNYPSISPVNALSGVISPTAFGLLASPVATPRTTPRNTPRSTPIPRWCTPFVGLDENSDYALMINLPVEEMLQDSGLLGMASTHFSPTSPFRSGLGYHFSGISENLEVSGNLAKVSEKSG